MNNPIQDRIWPGKEIGDFKLGSTLKEIMKNNIKNKNTSISKQKSNSIKSKVFSSFSTTTLSANVSFNFDNPYSEDIVFRFYLVPLVLRFDPSTHTLRHIQIGISDLIQKEKSKTLNKYPSFIELEYSGTILQVGSLSKISISLIRSLFGRERRMDIFNNYINNENEIIPVAILYFDRGISLFCEYLSNSSLNINYMDFYVDNKSIKNNEITMLKILEIHVFPPLNENEIISHKILSFPPIKDNIDNISKLVIDIQIGIGILVKIKSESLEIRLGENVENVKWILGEPNLISFKVYDPMEKFSNITRSRNSKELKTNSGGAVDYFYNYTDLGIDILFQGVTNVVKKIVIHSCIPGSVEFGYYNKGKISLDGLSIQSLSDIKSVLGKPEGKPLILNPNIESKSNIKFRSFYIGWSSLPIVVSYLSNDYISSIILF